MLNGDDISYQEICFLYGKVSCAATQPKGCLSRQTIYISYKIIHLQSVLLEVNQANINLVVLNMYFTFWVRFSDVNQALFVCLFVF